MKTYLCTNIKYDTDGEDVELPEDLTVVVEDDAAVSENELEELLADAISDETGWCVESFEYEPLLTTTVNDIAYEL